MIYLVIPTTAALFISYQDFKFREVYAFLFPIIFVSGITLNYSIGFESLINQVFLNVLFLLVISFLITAYFIIKYRSIKVISDKIGAGDFIFVLCISPFFKLEDYINFLSTSSLLCLLFFIPFILIKKSFSIPLAGFQALLFCPLIIAQHYEVEVFNNIYSLIF